MAGVHASPRVHNARVRMVVQFEGNMVCLLAFQIDLELETNRLKSPASTVARLSEAG